MSSSESVTEMLSSAATGDRSVAERLISVVYDELRELAAGYLSRERAGHTLQPTALVNEAYLKLVGADRKWKGRSHFLAAGALAMRRVLVDHARKRTAAKRGGAWIRIPFDGNEDLPERRDRDVIDLDILLDRLRLLDERRASVAAFRLFGGMSNQEIATVLEVARSTVSEDWVVARAWLAAEVSEREEA